MRYLTPLTILAAVILVLPASAATQPGTFPLAGVDLIDHKLRVELRQVNGDGSIGDLIETVTFKGRMLIERSDPYLNDDKLKQIDFVVKSWEAHGYSSALDTLITYRLSPDVKQELSSIVAQQDDSVFPATFRFRVTFDAVAFGEVFVESFEGEPEGNDFMEVPPSGNRRTSPTMTRFESARIEMDHPELGTVQFIPLDCGDEGGLTLQTFTAESGERTLSTSRGVGTS